MKFKSYTTEEKRRRIFLQHKRNLLMTKCRKIVNYTDLDERVINAAASTRKGQGSYICEGGGIDTGRYPTQTGPRKEGFREDAAAQDQLQRLKTAREDALQSAKEDGHNVHHCHHHHHHHHHPPSHQL